MEPKNQMNEHVVIVTSDAEDAKVKKYRIKPRILWAAIILVCMLIGALLGYVAYEEEIWNTANQKIEEYKEEVAVLEEAKAELEETNAGLQADIEGLNNKITILSDTINQMKATEEELTARIDKFATPTLVPITGSATIEEMTEGEPISIFNAAEGAVIVSTASGVVAEIGEDTDYGYRVVIDHGNGYMTIYRNEGKPMVATGDSVAQGGTLFVIDDDNAKLGYQITKDGVYVKPAELMEIKG